MNRTISCVTFNIRNGRACDGTNSWPFRRRWVPEYIRSLDADVVGLQEAYHNQALAVERALPEYRRVGVGRDNGRAKGEHCPIYVRSGTILILRHGTFWFSNTPDEPGSRTWGNTLPRICTWAVLAWADCPGRAMATVCNLHLDHASSHARMMGARLILENVAEWRKAGPVIVIGDFNAADTDPVIAMLLERSTGLRDAFRIIHPCETSVGTFHGWEGGNDGARIDYIMITPDVTVLDAAILHDRVAGRLPSDHWPVWALLQLEAQTSEG